LMPAIIRLRSAGDTMSTACLRPPASSSGLPEPEDFSFHLRSLL
jgi:hypothetical protein